MSIVDYTSYDDIRAALGVSVSELADGTISLSLYQNNLVAELEDISLNFQADYALLPAPPEIRTTVQTRLAQSAQVFATYAVAKALCTSLPMFGPKDTTDGKAALTRFSTDPYKETVKGVIAAYDRYKARLVTAYAALSSTQTNVSAVATFMLISSPDSDPVLGT